MVERDGDDYDGEVHNLMLLLRRIRGRRSEFLFIFDSFIDI